MRNIIACASLLMCLTGSASAMDFRDDLNSDHQFIQKVGWDQKNIDAQAGGFKYLRSQIRRLETENEQLRNSISLIRSGNTSYGKQKADPRILALIEENKRLSKLISKGGVLPKYTSTPSEEIYAQQISVLKAENQKLNAKLKGKLNRSENGSQKIVLLQKQIDDLKQENDDYRIKASNVSAISREIDQNALTLKKDAELNALKKALAEAQDENQETSASLAKVTEKALKYNMHADKVTDAYKNNIKALEILKQQLSDAQKENRDLEADIKLSSETFSSSSSNNKVDAIKQQNKSLRETISAQSEALLSADNASKTAERLLTENSNLQRKLVLVQKSGSSSGRRAKELASQVKDLQLDVAKRDHYIKKMLESKGNLASAADRSSAPSPISPAQSASLREKNKALVEGLDKERENNIAYRKKIVEYQKEVASLKGDRNASGSGIHKVSIYERHVKALEQKQKKAESDLTSIRLENQELKARINLLAKEDKKSASLLDDDVAEGDNKFEKEVASFIDTSYPSVERVLPIFDSQGNKILYDDEGKKYRPNQNHTSVEDMLEDRLAVNENAINPEALLAKELRPLSTK